MTRKLFPDGDYTFKERCGETYEKGKVHYPALLRLELSEPTAWRVVREILVSLQDRNDYIEDGRLTMQISLVGAIEQHDEEGNKIEMGGNNET